MSLEHVDAPFWYRGLSKILLQDFKFHKGWRLADFFSDAMMSFLPVGEWWLVPVPPKRSSLESRGWDPVEALWRRLKDVEHRGCKILERKEGGQQKQLGRKERKSNLEGQLFLRNHQVPEHVLLIDDTYTTGATLNCCAQVLLKNGAKRVRGLCATISP